LREVMAVMAGAGRLSGRGSVAVTAKTPMVALLAAQLFDFGTFTLMIGKHGIAAEVNPLVAQGYVTYGFPVLILVKLLLVVLLGSIVVLLARDVPTRPAARGFAATITVLAVTAGLIGGISNVLAG
jgi:hypothetical protein